MGNARPEGPPDLGVVVMQAKKQIAEVDRLLEARPLIQYIQHQVHKRLLRHLPPKRRAREQVHQCPECQVADGAVGHAEVRGGREICLVALGDCCRTACLPRIHKDPSPGVEEATARGLEHAICPS
jgi:hypothetical protein